MAQNQQLGLFGQYLTVNTTANTTLFSSNSTTFTNSLIVGNSTVNVVVNSSSVYVNGAPLISGANTSLQYSWTNTQTFSSTATFNSNVNINANLTVNAVSTFNSNLVTFNSNAIFNANATHNANTTFNANVIIGSNGDVVFSGNAGIYANGSFGTSGQTLTSNGTSVYWAAGGSGGFANGQSISVANIFVTGRSVFANSSGGSVVYMYYNSSTDSIDTVFG
jgi:hypothetical protein